MPYYGSEPHVSFRNIPEVIDCEIEYLWKHLVFGILNEVKTEVEIALLPDRSGFNWKPLILSLLVSADIFYKQIWPGSGPTVPWSQIGFKPLDTLDNVLIVLSTDNVYKQFEPWSGPSKPQSWSESELLDRLIVFLKDKEIKKLMIKSRQSLPVHVDKDLKNRYWWKFWLTCQVIVHALNSCCLMFFFSKIFFFHFFPLKILPVTLFKYLTVWIQIKPDILFSRPLIAQDKLFHRQNAVRNFLIQSTWPAYPIHMTCLSHPRDFKL